MEVGRSPEFLTSFGIHEATQARRKPFLYHLSQAPTGAWRLHTSLFGIGMMANMRAEIVSPL